MRHKKLNPQALFKMSAAIMDVAFPCAEYKYDPATGHGYDLIEVEEWGVNWEQKLDVREVSCLRGYSAIVYEYNQAVVEFSKIQRDLAEFRNEIAASDDLDAEFVIAEAESAARLVDVGTYLNKLDAMGDRAVSEGWGVDKIAEFARLRD